MRLTSNFKNASVSCGIGVGNSVRPGVRTGAVGGSNILTGYKYAGAASHYGQSCSAEIDRGGYGRI